MFFPRHTRQALKSGAYALVVAQSACDPSPPDYAPPAASVDTDTVNSGNVGTQGSGGKSQDPAEHEAPISVGGGLHGSEAGGAPSVTSAGRVASNSVAGIAGSSTRGGVSSAGAGGVAGARNTTTASSGDASTCAGNKPGALRGKTNQTVSVGGVSRTFVQYVPP